ncbi:MAG: aminoacyl-tRNA hydrolase [Candidatus Omnitrophica bacterium]|nr:aminoacyl-tRNA hydrolase [Candidatus Omnitrophota bacterium]
MKAILGLGNPGLRFSFSRHNLGFLVVEKLARHESIRIRQRGFSCLLGKGLIENQEVILAKPLSFMNLSGGAVASIVKGKKIKVSDLLVACDDVNLPLGKIRIRPKGSDGGHKGLRSIIEALGTQEFARLRVGVGLSLRQARGKLSSYVLGRFSKAEIKTINEAAGQAASACVVWARDGIKAAMNKFNEDKS